MDSVVNVNDMQWIEFDYIEANPYRDLIRNPLTEEQVSKLQKSVEATGFWHGCIVRSHPDKLKYYQLMFGHARVEAAKRAGLTGAFFTVQNVSDERAIVLMNNENSTQGGDRYKAVAESVRAAEAYIMLKLLDNPERADKFISTLLKQDEPENIARTINDVKNGGHIGRDVVHRFFNGTLTKPNIQVALEVMESTGEFKDWHNANNPFLKSKEPIKPVVSQEAISHFKKPDHVRTFTKAVKDMKIPVEQQPRLIEVIKHKLAEPPKTLASGRESFQADIESDKRFNSTNIRKIVVEEGLNLTRNKRQKDKLARDQAMTTLERNLTDIETGLTRAASGYNQLKLTIKLLGGLQDTDYTNNVDIKLNNIAGSIRRLERLLSVKDVRELLQITYGE